MADHQILHSIVGVQFLNGDGPLICPRCGSANLHHIGVTVFDRREDAPTVVKTIVRAGVVYVDPKSDGEENPSSRRDGLVIVFGCEDCTVRSEDGAWIRATLELTIQQHKGGTFFGWRF